MTTKVHKSVTLGVQQWRRLETEAARLDISVSELLRRLVDKLSDAARETGG
jgi:macrodomain Ter protein organizer (MatP/YcbG family)